MLPSVPGACWAELDLLAMQGVRYPIPVPGACWAEPGFASNSGRQVPDSGARHLLGPSQDLLAIQGVRCPIPVPGTCWAELDLLAMQGVRCSIPVPGTCWGRARFASNAGRQVLDSGARQSDSSRPTTAWQRMATTRQQGDSGFPGVATCRQSVEASLAPHHRLAAGGYD